jgi:hypothetical protein
MTTERNKLAIVRRLVSKEAILSPRQSTHLKQNADMQNSTANAFFTSSSQYQRP